MCTSWDSGALLVEEYEALIKAFPELNPELAERVGRRTGERKAMYLSRKDFERHGLTDGCPGCRDISIRSGRISAHNVACRRRMENAVREADPDRWARQATPRAELMRAYFATPQGKAMRAKAQQRLPPPLSPVTTTLLTPSSLLCAFTYFSPA